MHVRDHKTDNVFVEFMSDMTAEEAESLIGKTIAKVKATEYVLELVFADGSTVMAVGGRWDGCSLGVTIAAQRREGEWR